MIEKTFHIYFIFLSIKYKPKKGESFMDLFLDNNQFNKIGMRYIFFYILKYCINFVFYHRTKCRLSYIRGY